jgi:parvulin-like peptidyl-prolyl isomerase
MGIGALGLAGCGSDDLPDGTAARVGDAPITDEQLERQVEQSLAAFESQGQLVPGEDSDEYRQIVRQSMQTLVQQQIITAEARKCGEPCAVSRDDVTEELASIIETEFGGSNPDFNAFLEERKLTRADARAIVRNSLYQQRLFDHVTRGVRFTEEDARAYYDENPDEFSAPAGRTASHILVATEEEAEQIREDLTTENFAAVARRESTDTGSAPQGGDLGVIQRGQLVPEFEQAAFALGDGEISEPVETQFGWHLITVSLVPASTTPFAEAKDGIIPSQLQQRRQEEYQRWAEKAISDWEDRTVYARDELKPPSEDEQEDAGVEPVPEDEVEELPEDQVQEETAP